MRHSVLLIILILSSINSWGKTVPATNVSMENLMVEARDPLFQDARKQYLQIAQTHMQQKLARDLKTTPDKLSKSFVDNQAHMNLLWAPEWINLQSEFYTTLHQEMLHDRWLTKTKNKKVSDYGKNIADAMFFHLSTFSTIKEGQLYNRWNEISINKAGKTNKYRIPSFIFANNTNLLLSLDAHTPYEKLFPKEAKASLGNPSLSTFLRNAGTKTREEYQLLAEKIQLNHRIYIRAVANSAKTVASVHYLTGEFSYTQTEAKVNAFIEGFCDGCSLKEKEDYKNSAMVYVKKTKKTFSQTYNGSKDVVTSFCSDLVDNNYVFDEPVKAEPIGLFQKPYIAVQDNTRVDQTSVLARIGMQKINALRQTIQGHDLGVLFLTHNLTQLSSDRLPLGTYLGCRPETLSYDMQTVSKAIVEARKNVEFYISNINSKILNSTDSLKNATETLEYFTQTNVSATSEAVMTFPMGIGHVLDTVLELDRDARRRKRIDKMVTWGGTIVGVALTISGIGAPEGVVILLAVGAMAKGIISGTYNLYRAQQEKAFFREMQIAMKGLGKEFYLNDNMSKHYSSYRNLRINYILDFGGAILSFAHIHKIALTRNAGSIPKAHGFMRRIMQQLKLSGVEIGEDQLSQALLTSIIN